MRQQDRRDQRVVVAHLTLGEPVRRVQHLVQIGQGEPAVSRLHGDSLTHRFRRGRGGDGFRRPRGEDVSRFLVGPQAAPGGVPDAAAARELPVDDLPDEPRLDQRARTVSSRGGVVANGWVRRSSGCSRAIRSARVAWLKPVPTSPM